MTRLISAKSSRLKTRQTAGPDLSSFLFFLFLGIELFDTQYHAKTFITWNCGDPQVSVNTGRVSDLINSGVNNHFSPVFFSFCLIYSTTGWRFYIAMAGWESVSKLMKIKKVNKKGGKGVQYTHASVNLLSWQKSLG